MAPDRHIYYPFGRISTAQRQRVRCERCASGWHSRASESAGLVEDGPWSGRQSVVSRSCRSTSASERTLPIRSRPNRPDYRFATNAGRLLYRLRTTRTVPHVLLALGACARPRNCPGLDVVMQVLLRGWSIPWVSTGQRRLRPDRARPRPRSHAKTVRTHAPTERSG
jgi:hypothetical protein